MKPATTLTKRPRARAVAAPLVDWAAPLYVMGYLLVTFTPFQEITSPPGVTLSGLIPAAGVALLLFTPTDRIVKMPICLPLVAYAGWNAASVMWSDSPDATLYLLRSQLLPLLVVTAVAGTLQWQVLVKTILSFFLAVSAWSIVASLVFPGSGVLIGADSDPSFHGTFGHKNDLGVFAVLSLAMVLPLYQGKWRRYIIVLLVATAVGTRSATAAGGLATVLFVWIGMIAVDRGRSKRDRQVLRTSAIVLAIVAILTTLRLTPFFLVLYDKDVTFSGRTIIWRETMKSVAERPWFGHGFGGVWTQAPTMLRIELWQQIGFPAAHAHNGAIQLLLDTGIIGLSLMFVFLVAVGRLAARALRYPATRQIGRWGVLSLATLLVTGLAEPVLGVPQIGLMGLLWVVLASAEIERRGRIRRPSATTF